MRFDIKGNPSYGEVDVDLGPNETLLIEPGAMSRMSSNTVSYTHLTQPTILLV